MARKHINQRNYTRKASVDNGETKDREKIIHSKSIRKVSLQFQQKHEKGFTTVPTNATKAEVLKKTRKLFD